MFEKWSELPHTIGAENSIYIKNFSEIEERGF